MRPLKNIRSGLLAFSVVVLCCAAGFAQQDLVYINRPAAWQEDASLTDVHFLDRRNGWCVGDQGTVLRTADGGTSWHVVSTTRQTRDHIPMQVQQFAGGVAFSDQQGSRPVRVRFECIQFVDEKHGWIAGGYTVPYVHRSHGFMLRTSDGGRTWEIDQGSVLPRIRGVEFTDPYTGRAWGDRSSLFPAGIFLTHDGGLTWSSESFTSDAGLKWTASTGDGFCGIDTHGRAVVLRPPAFQDSVVPSESGQICDIEMVDGRNGWAAGKRGTVLVTSNGGRTWSWPTNLTPGSSDPTTMANRRLVRQFDFQDICLTDTAILLAADPGRILSIDRKTGQIDAIHTGVTSALNRIQFVDAERGYAVGDNGVILATIDGGKAWHAQRNSRAGVALLSIATLTADTPPDRFPAWEALARYAGEENYLTAALLLSDPTFEQNNPATLETMRKALAVAGCNRVAHEPFDDWNNVDQLDLTERLVRRIRAMQPLVITTGSDPYFNRILQNAVAAAGDPARFPDQITLGGLSHWKVMRLAVASRDGTARVDLKQMLTGSGCLVEDRIAISRALAGQIPFAAEATRFDVFRVNGGAAGSSRGSSGLLDGLARTRIPKRATGNGVRGTISMVKHLSQKENLMSAIVRTTDVTQSRQRDFVQQMIGQLDAETAGIWLLQLADRFAGAGNFEHATRMLELFTLRYPDHALAPAMLFKLVECYSSEEIALAEYEKLEATGPGRVAELPAHVTSTARQTNIGGVLRTTYEVDMSVLPEGGSWHYGSDKPVSAEERRVMDRWNERMQQIRQQDEPRPPAAEESRSSVETTDDESRNSSGVSATTRPALAHDEPPPQTRPNSRAAAAPLPENLHPLLDPSVSPASHSAPATPVAAQRVDPQIYFLARFRRASRMLTMIEQRDAELGVTPEFQFLEAHVTRQLGGWGQAEPLYERLNKPGVPRRIRTAVRRELGAQGERGTHRTGNSITVRHIQGRPHLDGRPDENFWRALINSGDIQRKTHSNGLEDFATFAHNDEYLFVMIRCRKTGTETTQRNLEQFDRTDHIFLRIDGDRDFSSTADFEVSSTGLVRDSWTGCELERRIWHVANSADELAWWTEIAIPLDTLRVRTEATPDRRMPMAISIGRRNADGRELWVAAADEFGSPRSTATMPPVRDSLLVPVARDANGFELLILQAPAAETGR